jgi:hypothetical protein
MMPVQAKLEDAVTGQQAEYILVPRKPTKEMLEAAWADALGEDAAGVWKAMIDNWESASEKWEFSNR